MNAPAKYASDRALAVLKGRLANELSIRHFNAGRKSKTYLCELGGPGGRQFGLVIGAMFRDENPQPPKQSRVLLEKCRLPDIPGVVPCDDNYNGHSLDTPPSRLAAPNQTSCLVTDETALVALLRWYAANGSAIAARTTSEPAGSLDRARIEKAGEDAGFDLTPQIQGNWLLLGSTAFPQKVGACAQSDGSYRIGLAGGQIGERIAAEFGIPAAVAPGPWRVSLDPIPDYQTLHRLLHRIAAVCRVVAGFALKEFQQQSRNLPGSTEITRQAVQRVGQNIFRASLLDYWGGRCAVTSLAVPELLRASHIKPWAACESDAERLDVFNGLLLAPHLDALFDGGWVTFMESGQIEISASLDEASRMRLAICGTERLVGLGAEHRPYLAWHREHVFRRKVAPPDALP